MNVKMLFLFEEKYLSKNKVCRLLLNLTSLIIQLTISLSILVKHPIGAGRIRELDTSFGKVERVCVLPEYRGKHLGNLVMHALEEHAKNKGLTKLVLNAQSYAVPFYEKLGFIITSPEFMDADIPHRAMEKTIE